MQTMLHIAALTAAVLGIARFLPGVEVKGWRTAIIVAVVFSLLNYFLGWLVSGLLHVVLALPALLTLGLAFVLIPFIVNTTLLWLTDKLIGDFEIKTWRALLGSALVITVVNGLFHAVARHHQLPGF
jgi:putative membrane protein